MENNKLLFFESLTTLLKGEVKTKSEDTIRGEKICDKLKMQITKLFEETYKLNMFSEDFNLRACISQNIDFPLERMKEQVEKTWLRNKLTLGLMGHFDTGKTTALNILFGESFKTCEDENTALATYLIYGSNNNIVKLVDKSGQTQEITMEECKILDYSSGVRDFPFARIFDYMVKENLNDALKELTIIDTPGLFSTTKSHSTPALNVVHSCDAIFWFINITDSIKEEDIKTIKEHIKELPLYFVFSFVDAFGTTPSEVESSIQRILKIAEKKEIKCNGYLKLGKKQEIQNQFKEDAFTVLNKLKEEHKIYRPSVYVSGIINFLEDFLVKCKTRLSEKIGSLDTETNQLKADYEASRRTIDTECENCMKRYNNMVDTFNKRCGPPFCGGAADALSNNINSFRICLSKMIESFYHMDVSKLIDYGDGLRQMDYFQYKQEKASEILENLIELKKILE